MSRAHWGVILRAAAYVLVIGFLGYQLWRARAGIAPSLHTVGWGYAALATALAAIGGVPGFIGWRLLLGGLGVRLPLLSAIQVFFVAGLTRYLPGGIWPALAHAVQARPLGQSPARMGAAYLGSQVIGVLAGPAVGLIALPWLVAANPLWWALPAVAVVALVPMAVPNLLDRLLALARRVFRREGQPVPLPSRGRLFGITGFMMGGWTISGLHVAVLAIALGAPPVAALTVGVGGFSLAVVAGIAALFLPSGLGVRELVLGLTLATLVTGPGLITIVALSRVLITVADLLSTAVVLGLLTVSSRALTPVKVAS
jgi:hypothetical protein